MKKFEYNKKTNTLIIFFQEIILKIPLSFRSFKIIRNEIKNYFIIKNDDLFSNNVLNIKSFYFFFQIKKLSKLECNKKNIFFKKYLEKFKNLKTKIFFSEIENIEILKDYINKHNPELTNIFEKYISDKKILYSSSHGDLYYRNIVKEQNKYYYIDLSNYSKKSCFVFDLINYKIFSSKYYNGNWYNFYKNKKKYFLKTLNNEYIELYVLWKIINEIKFIKLNKYKIKKYNFILNDFFKNFINK